jgi:hypothetical protein
MRRPLVNSTWGIVVPLAIHAIIMTLTLLLGIVTVVVGIVATVTGTATLMEKTDIGMDNSKERQHGWPRHPSSYILQVIVQFLSLMLSSL